MKRVLSLIFAMCLVLSMSLMPVSAVSEETSTEPDWVDADLSQEQIDDILALNPNNTQTRATGLIRSYSFAIDLSGSTLYVVGTVTCTDEVVKCGFEEVIIQRRASSSNAWSTYKTYEDLYNESTSYLLSKSLTVSTSYQYRATCVHYAKKHIFSVQRIDNVSNIV